MGACAEALKTRRKDKEQRAAFFVKMFESLAENCGYSIKDPAKQLEMPFRLHEYDTLNTLEAESTERLPSRNRLEETSISYCSLRR